MDKVSKQLAACAADELKYFPKLVSNRKNPPHIRFVADKIQYAIENPNPEKYKLLVIHAPPRHGKSDLISVHTPAWILGNYPAKKIICSSYSSDLAKDHNGMARDIYRQWSHILWEQHIHPKKQNQSLWRTTKGGACKASGVGGPITGFGADCICKGQKIKTGFGYEKIETVVDNLLKYKVLSYNHEKNIVEEKRIIAVQKKLSDKRIVEVQTIFGNKLRCTIDHLFYTENRGYIKAGDLKKGDIVFTWKDKENCLFKVFSLWKNLSQIFLRSFKTNKKRTCGFLLFFLLFKKTSFNKKHKKTILSKLWKTFQSKKRKQEVLFNKMSKVYKKIKKENMSKLWETISAYKSQVYVLLQNLCKPKTFKNNARKRELSLQKWSFLQSVVQGIKNCCFGKRSFRLFSLWNKSKAFYSSYRSQLQKQFYRKLNNFMFHTSCNTSQIKKDTISRVKIISGEENVVYDIQVEGNSNFFAEKILVHNCFIIDDYCKGREEAESDVMRKKIWNWWEAVVATRLHPGAVVIILATRWHDADLIGRLKSEYKKCLQNGEEFPFDFEDICLPAIAEENDQLGRKEGTALWPWRYSSKLLARVEKIVGPYEWSALFRGDPVSRGGNLFKSVYFRYWDIDIKNGDYVCHRVDSEPIRVRKTELIRRVYVDPAVEAKRKNDPSGMSAWGYSRKHKIWLLLDVLVDRIEHTKLFNQILTFAFKNKATQILAENEKLGKVLVKQSAGNDNISGMKIPFKEYPTGGLDKYARATPMATYVENERVFFPRGAPWIADYEDYLVKFPNVDHDEHIDITSMAQEMETKLSVAEILAQKNK